MAKYKRTNMTLKARIYECYEYALKSFQVRRKMLFSKKIKMLSTQETVRQICEQKKSLARFGDGEFALMEQVSGLPFQKIDDRLSDRLKQILSSDGKKCLIGVPGTLVSFKNYRLFARRFDYRQMYAFRDRWMSYLNEDNFYCDSCITRFYLRFRNKSGCRHSIELIKSIWQDRNILIVEGEHTGFGARNDLLINARSVKRLMCPAENAYDKYEMILNETIKHGENRLIVIALGPTATILAYDLAQNGQWAVDLGHFDLEYEWFRRDMKSGGAIEGKYVNESPDGRNVREIEDEKMRSEIVSRIV